MKKQYLEVGKIVNTHGLKGEMKLQLWCTGIEFLENMKALYLDSSGEQPVRLLSVRPQKRDALICIDGVNSIDSAALLKNKVLYMDRSDVQLPPDHHYIQDLIGCKVIDIDSGKVYGIVKDVVNLGASDIYVLVNEEEQELMIPAIPDIVRELDMDSAVIRIKKMKGLFEDED